MDGELKLQRQDYRIALVFPPVWTVEIPYLSTAALTAFLRGKGYNVIQYDLNIEFWDHLKCESEIRSIHQRILDEGVPMINVLTRKDRKTPDERRLLDVLQYIVCLSYYEFANQVQHEDIPAGVFRFLCKLFSRFSSKDNFFLKPWDDPVKYNDRFFNSISYSSYAVSSESLVAMATDTYRNLYIPFYKEHFLDKLSVFKPHLVGITVAGLNQVIPAFSLAWLLKKKGVHKVVIGGAWCTHLGDILQHKTDIFNLVDGIIVFEGEYALSAFADAVRTGTSFYQVPNLIHKEDVVVHVNRIESAVALNSIPTPDFDGLPLEKYEFKSTLPIQASRGCYWAKCAFCSYCILEPEYRTREAKLVVEDMHNLTQLYGAKQFCFADACISPDRLIEISQEIISAGVEIGWMCYGRFDRRLSEKIISTAVRAGCKGITWGLESGSQRILNLLHKGISLSKVREILEFSTKVGLQNKPCAMFGLPTETVKDVKKTINFVKRNSDIIQSFDYTYYVPERGTEIIKHNGKYGLTINIDSNEDLAVSYRRHMKIKPLELESLDAEFDMLVSLIEEISW